LAKPIHLHTLVIWINWNRRSMSLAFHKNEDWRSWYSATSL